MEKFKLHPESWMTCRVLNVWEREWHIFLFFNPAIQPISRISKMVIGDHESHGGGYCPSFLSVFFYLNWHDLNFDMMRTYRKTAFNSPADNSGPGIFSISASSVLFFLAFDAADPRCAYHRLHLWGLWVLTFWLVPLFCIFVWWSQDTPPRTPVVGSRRGPDRSTQSWRRSSRRALSVVADGQSKHWNDVKEKFVNVIFMKWKDQLRLIPFYKLLCLLHLQESDISCVFFWSANIFFGGTFVSISLPRSWV